MIQGRKLLTDSVCRPHHRIPQPRAVNAEKKVGAAEGRHNLGAGAAETSTTCKATDDSCKAAGWTAFVQTFCKVGQHNHGRGGQMPAVAPLPSLPLDMMARHSLWAPQGFERCLRGHSRWVQTRGGSCPRTPQASDMLLWGDPDGLKLVEASLSNEARAQELCQFQACSARCFCFSSACELCFLRILSLIPSHLSLISNKARSSKLGVKVTDMMQIKRRIVASPLQSWCQPESGSCQGDRFYSLPKPFSELALAARSRQYETLQTGYLFPSSIFNLPVTASDC